MYMPSPSDSGDSSRATHYVSDGSPSVTKSDHGQNSRWNSHIQTDEIYIRLATLWETEVISGIHTNGYRDSLFPSFGLGKKPGSNRLFDFYFESASINNQVYHSEYNVSIKVMLLCTSRTTILAWYQTQTQYRWFIKFYFNNYTLAPKQPKLTQLHTCST